MRAWPVSTRLVVATMVALCWIRQAESATCSFTNAVPTSMGVHVALSDTSSGSATVTSSLVPYGSTAYFTCVDGITQYVHLYNSDNSLMGTQFVMSGFYCQAINMMSLEPESYGSTSYNLDFPVSLPITAVSSGHVRVFLLNSAINGIVVWKFQLAGGVWEFLANTTSFGAGGVFDLSTGSTDATMKCEDSTGVEIASVTFNYASDSEMGIHLTLMGSSGSEQLKYIRGCGSSGANCNSCSSSDGLSTTMIIMVIVIVVLGLALIGIGSYVIVTKCRPQGGTAQVVHPAQVAQLGMGTGTVPVVTGVAIPGATEPKDAWSLVVPNS